MSRSNFAHGHILFEIPHSAVDARKRGQGGYVELTRSVSDCIASIAEQTATTIASYPAGFPYTVWEYWQRIRDYSGVGYLSSAQYNTGGGAARIKSAIIDGNEIKLTITNTHPSLNSTIDLKGFYRVEGIA